MRAMDVERLAASYGLAIYTLGSLMYVELLNRRFAWGPDGRWDLLPAPNAMISLCAFVPGYKRTCAFVPDSSLSPEKVDVHSNQVDEHSNPEGCVKILDHRVVEFVRNSTYDMSILKIRNLDELKQFFDDFHAKWAERRKMHKIQEISSITGDYTV